MLETKYFGFKSNKFNTPEQGATDAIVWLPMLLWDAYPMGKFFHGHEEIPE